MNRFNTSSRIAAALAALGFTIALPASAQSGAANAAPAVQVAATAQNSAPAKPAAQAVDSIVAIINEEVITRQELQRRIATTVQRMQAAKVAPPPESDLQRQVLERMIYDKVQILAAKDSGIRVDDNILDRAIARIAEQNKMTVQQMRDQMEKEGLPFVTFREDIREEIIISRFREGEIERKIQISESEVDNFLSAESLLAQNQSEYNLAHILVRIPENASPEQIAEKRARATEVLEKAKGGADFAKLAGTYSDASDALSGGDLGWRSPERMPQLFFDAIAKLNPGDVAQPVRSPNGFHVIKLTGKRKPDGTKNDAQAITQTRARHILIKVNQIVSATDAKRKLVEIKERLANKAAKFEDLAKSFSNDGSASKGGDLGWLYPGDTVPEFEKAMNELKPGEISEPIESPFGFHLIEVLERKTDDVSGERKRLAARQALRERKIEETGEEWLRQLRDRAYVETRLDER